MLSTLLYDNIFKLKFEMQNIVVINFVNYLKY